MVDYDLASALLPKAAVGLIGLREAGIRPERTSRIYLWWAENYLRPCLLLDLASESPGIVQ